MVSERSSRTTKRRKWPSPALLPWLISQIGRANYCYLKDFYPTVKKLVDRVGGGAPLIRFLRWEEAPCNVALLRMFPLEATK